MRIGKGLAQAIFIGRHGDQVDVMGHETVAPDFGLGVERRYAQKIKVRRGVPFFKEDPTVPVATLGDG